MTMRRANHAVQRTRPGGPHCKQPASCAALMSLGHWAEPLARWCLRGALRRTSAALPMVQKGAGSGEWKGGGAWLTS
jgi:hypothetical protein